MRSTTASRTGQRGDRSRRTTPLIVEVRVRSAAPGDPLGTKLRRSGLRTHLVSCRPSAHDGRPRLLRWVDLQGSPAELARLSEELRVSRPSNEELRVSVGRGRAALRVSGPLPKFCAAVFEAGGVCVACPLLAGADDRSRVRTRVLLPRDAGAAHFTRAVERRDLGPFSIERTGPFRARSSRTPRQEQALRVAFEVGLFSYPRRATLADVARRLGVGRSATLELVRRALSDLVASQFHAFNGPEDRF